MVSQFPCSHTSLFDAGAEPGRALMPKSELTLPRQPRPRLVGALWSWLEGPLLAPLRAFRLAYLPLLAIYLASGALGLVAVADAFWVKKSLTLPPAELASLAVWLQLPWSAKMVVSEFVDSVPILGSQRRSYALIGGGLIAAGLLLLAGAAGGWIGFASPERIYAMAQLLVVIGGVVQEVVADAMGPEVVPRHLPDGSPRP
jgi:BT1 family